MKDKKIEIKQGITFHQIETNKFKTNLLAVFLTLPLIKETVTKNALFTAVLRRGSKNMPSQEIISKNLEEMYGASFDCGVEKSGDLNTIKFYLEVINDEYLPEKEDLSKKAIQMLLNIIFDPYIENGAFKEEYLVQEKENLKQIIEGKADNKAAYALERCIEEMYKDKPYGLYKYGYVEDLEKISAKDLYEYYLTAINQCKIDIFTSGENLNNLEQEVLDNENIKSMEARKLDIHQNNEKEEIKETKKVSDSMDVTQGKLVIGLDILSDVENLNYISMVYNTILGVGSNSKLFQNVREKASLAYVCSSNYIRRKQIILIRAGIEIENYEKAVKIINEQLEDMKNGNFTDEDFESAKTLIFATINNIEEEQDTEISYYFGQEIAQTDITIEEYKQKIQNVTKDQVVELANKINKNTIYFLKN